MRVLAATVSAGMLLAAVVTAAQAPRPKPKASEKPPQTREKPREASRTSPVVVETDLACQISIDGGPPMELPANGIATLQLEPGEHLLRAVSKDYADVIWRKAIEVARDQRRAIVIELRALAEASKAAEEKRLAAEAELRRLAEKPSLPALLIRADMNAEIAVNGGPPASVKAGESVRVPVSVGQNRVDAKATGTDVTWTATIDVEKPVQMIVDTELLKAQEERRRRDAAVALLATAVGAWEYTETRQSTFPMFDSKQSCTVQNVTTRRVVLQLTDAELTGEATFEYDSAPVARGCTAAAAAPTHNVSRSEVRIGVSSGVLRGTLRSLNPPAPAPSVPAPFGSRPAPARAEPPPQPPPFSVAIETVNGQAQSMVWIFAGTDGQEYRTTFKRQ